MLRGSMQESKTLQARILSGSVVLLSGSGLATAINFAYNIAVARFLGPSGYGHATAVYTLLTLISAVTLSFQIVSAKLVAQQESPEGKSSAYRIFHMGSWACGILTALVLLLFRQGIADYLNLPNALQVVLLAIGAAFYVPLGSRRGYIQGAYGFRLLATNLVFEGAVRLGGSLLVIWLGWGVEGVIGANAAAIAVAYFAAMPRLATSKEAHIRLPYALRETFQAMVFFAGQVLINNCDIVLVKHFFPPRAAGLYAAVAMVGRVIFAFSSAIVNSMFPLVAGTSDEERKDLKVIATSLMMVLSIGSALAIGLRLAPAAIWTAFFGSEFGMAGAHGLPYLLSLYAITTVVYSLSVVIITYEMSYKIANTSWIQLAFSGVVAAGIYRFHSTLSEVIWVQLWLMFVLLIFVALPFLISSLTDPQDMKRAVGLGRIKVLGSISEDEVIAEFLRSDFNHQAFREYQDTLSDLVFNPNLNDAEENAKRRALLYVRHLNLWKELPTDTEWFEVELHEADLEQVRVFPRAQWQRLARGNFLITEVADRMRNRHSGIDSAFASKIDAISECLVREDTNLGSVLLIGVDDREPLTILDGNHRLVAAMLASPSRMQKLRFLCGLSPRMSECCWYSTNLVTLFRYAKNVLSHVVSNAEAKLIRALQSAG